MRKTIAIFLAAVLLGLSVMTTASAAATPVQVTLSADQITHEVNPNMYGIFIEDINNAVEGGLNANLVRNNSFEYLHQGSTLSGWSFDGDYLRTTDGGMYENNPTYISVPASGARTVKNYGFCEYFDYKTYTVNEKSITRGGMGIQAGETYMFSAWFKNTRGNVSVYLEDNRGEKISDTTTFMLDAGETWKQFSVRLSAAKTAEGILVIAFSADMAASIDYVCLYPEKSYGYGSEVWKYTYLRPDFYSALSALHPAFIRFPGGCVAEGDSLETLFNWKDTIGPLESRKQAYNLWQTDVIDYNNSYAIGYHEYFQLCNDLGAEPVPILNAGLICQARCGYDETYAKYETGVLSEADWQAYLDTIALRPGTAAWDAYVQDILDLIEYANGDVTTEWGARRAQNGHPAPFGLDYIGLGNENWGDVYFRNFAALKQAVQAVYPNINILSSAGPVSTGAQFDASWETLQAQHADTIVDEHYYQEDHWYLDNTDRYDSYDRNGAKVFLGEYAATSKGIGTIQTKSNLKAALAEAAYLTGLERNGDVVTMASYAPLFAKINAQEWTINMIWFDAHNVVLTPSYYTQMLFMNNTGSKYMDAQLPQGSDGLYQSVTVDEANEVIYVKLVNTTGEAKEMTYVPEGFSSIHYSDVLMLADRSQAACNEIGKTRIVPVTKSTTAGASETPSISFKAEGYSVNVLRITYNDNTNGKGLYSLPQMPDSSRYFTALETGLLWGVPIGAAAVVTAVIFGVRGKRKKSASK